MHKRERPLTWHRRRAEFQNKAGSQETTSWKKTWQNNLTCLKWQNCESPWCLSSVFWDESFYFFSKSPVTTQRSVRRVARCRAAAPDPERRGLPPRPSGHPPGPEVRQHAGGRLWPPDDRRPGLSSVVYTWPASHCWAHPGPVGEQRYPTVSSCRLFIHWFICIVVSLSVLNLWLSWLSTDPRKGAQSGRTGGWK